MSAFVSAESRRAPVNQIRKCLFMRRWTGDGARTREIQLGRLPLDMAYHKGYAISQSNPMET